MIACKNGLLCMAMQEWLLMYGYDSMQEWLLMYGMQEWLLMHGYDSMQEWLVMYGYAGMAPYAWL